MSTFTAGVLALALIQGRFARDHGPGVITSNQLQGLHFADLDDSSGRGSIGQGQLSRSPSRSQASPTRRSKTPGVITSDQIQGLHFADLDDILGRGSIGQGQLSRSPSRSQASPTGGSKTPGVITSDQLQGAFLLDDPFLKAGQSRPPPPPRPEDNLLSIEQLERKLLSPAEYELKHPPSQGDLTMLGKITTDPVGKEHLSTYEGVTKHVKLETRKVSAYNTSFNDPLWNKQWYLHDYRTTEMPVMDLNVVPVWNMGITGKGVYVAVVDDGVVHDHPDLAANHDKALSFDYNSGVAGSQPDPPKGSDNMMHGTECAGVIAMVANNGVCGVGIAHGATIIGVKTMGEQKFPAVLDFSESRSANSYEDGKGLVHRMDIVDISSNSYGALSDGKFPQYISKSKEKFIDMGIKEGRGGKGTIYFVASGNGRDKGDTCGADAAANHLGMIAISAVGNKGKVAYYAEGCSAVFATTYSDGFAGVDVSTIDTNNGCTTSFTGTSASTPVAAAIVALVMEAAKKKGKELTYRDVMHIIAMGSEVAPLADNMDRRGQASAWTRNGAGFWASNDFGFGLLNAKNMVKLAQEWQNVGEMHSCTIPVPMGEPITASVESPATIEFEVRGCQVKWLESVQLRATVGAKYRGAIEIALISPAGTKAYVMESRQKDDKGAINDWVFKSVHTWGENPEGRWTIQVISTKLYGVPDSIGYAKSFKLVAHGLQGPPPHRHKLPRTYSAFRLTDGKTSHDP